MSDKGVVTITLGIALAVLAVFVIPIALHIHAGTERHNACVEAGGSYVKVINSVVFECRN